MVVLFYVAVFPYGEDLDCEPYVVFDTYLDAMSAEDLPVGTKIYSVEVDLHHELMEPEAEVM